MYQLMTAYKIKKKSAQQHTSLFPSYSQIKSFSKKCNFYLRINAEAYLSLRNSNVGLCQTVFNPKNSGIPTHYSPFNNLCPLFRFQLLTL